MIAPATRLWTVENYYHMTQAGILSPEERVELLDGEVISMAVKKPPHVVTTKLASDYIERLLSGLTLVRVQDPIHLNQYSEPEPDIAVVMPPVRRYIKHHPSVDEIFLLIEVADSTLRFDTEKKALAYARASIPDYWVVDTIARQVYIFREPQEGKYTKKLVLSESSTIMPLAFPEIEVELVEFFP